MTTMTKPAANAVARRKAPARTPRQPRETPPPAGLSLPDDLMRHEVLRGMARRDAEQFEVHAAIRELFVQLRELGESCERFAAEHPAGRCRCASCRALRGRDVEADIRQMLRTVAHLADLFCRHAAMDVDLDPSPLSALFERVGGSGA